MQRTDLLVKEEELINEVREEVVIVNGGMVGGVELMTNLFC